MVKHYDISERYVNLNGYEIIIAPSFWKSLKKIDKSLADSISDWIFQELIPDTGEDKIVKVRPLLGDLTGQFRIRRGKYRIVVTINDNELIFTFLKIAHRKEVYK